MAERKYTKEELENIIRKAEKIEKTKSETYSQEDVERIAKRMKISKHTLKEAMKIHDKSTSTTKKASGSSSFRKFKRYFIYIFYTVFWAAFITLLVVVPTTYENRWSSWTWLIPSIAFVGLIMGAFINELEGAVIGMFAGGLSGLLIIYLTNWLWGQLIIALTLIFVAFLVFLFRFKGQIDAVIK